MKIKMSKRQVEFLMACIVELEQSEFWYNTETRSPVTATLKGRDKIAHIRAIVEESTGRYGDPNDEIYEKYLVEMVEKKS